MAQEEKILALFQFNEKLKFSEIESSLNIRSNKLAYHIKQLINKKVLIKQGEYYLLSESAEYLIPYLSGKNSPLVVILIKIGDSNKCFLHKRIKRPHKGKLSLPGGRLLMNESFEEAVTRIMDEKHNIKAKLIKINSINLEFLKRGNKRVHSFILILVSAKAQAPLTEVTKNKKNIISSDYKLIISKDKEIKIPVFNTKP